VSDGGGGVLVVEGGGGDAGDGGGAGVVVPGDAGVVEVVVVVELLCAANGCFSWVRSSFASCAGNVITVTKKNDQGHDPTGAASDLAVRHGSSCLRRWPADPLKQLAAGQWTR